MMRIDRNNFYENEKKSTIYTPPWLSVFLCKITRPHLPKNATILDPCVGKGSLLKPWVKRGHKVVAYDLIDQGFPNTIQKNFLNIKATNKRPSLVLLNPPFNMDDNNREFCKKKFGGRPLLPELFIDQIFSLYGKDVPVVLITPYGLRLNLTADSKRWHKFSDADFPPITSIISLPKNTFEGILFHVEILIFNIPQLKPHYFAGVAWPARPIVNKPVWRF